jgi:hypothetical protein
MQFKKHVAKMLIKPPPPESFEEQIPKHSSCQICGCQVKDYLAHVQSENHRHLTS